MSGASERANGRASGPVLTSLFLFVPDHSAVMGVGVVEVKRVIAGGMGSGQTDMSNERKGKVTVKGHGGGRRGRKIRMRRERRIPVNTAL